LNDWGVPIEKNNQPAQTTRARLGLALFCVLLLSAGLFLWLQSDTQPALVLPDHLTVLEETGSKIFHDNCASCHGTHAAGGKSGPPLIHRHYEPNLHGDSTFYDAVRFGTRAHHWNFGDMPRIDDLDEASIAAIVAWVRKVQAANGIHWDSP
jgi:mono/diheme cytochrome c family protein